jgi:hypothetical protein
LKECYAGSGGAIDIYGNASCIIDSCVITENEAGDFGGGITNSSSLTIRNTKLFNNKAVNGGADIGNKVGATLVLQDSLEQLIELFKDDGIIPKGWVCDYDFENGIYIPDVDPTIENSLLKMEFEYEQPETTEPEQPPETEEPETEEPETPSGTEEPTEQQPEETEGNEQDKEPENPSQDDTTEGTNPSESETEGTEQEPDETTPSTIPNVNTDNSTTDSSTTNTTTTSNSTTGDTVTNNSSNSSTDNSTSSSNTSSTSSTEDNSRYSNTSDSNNTSTVNNYYQQTETQPSNQQGVQTIVIPVDNAEKGEPIEQTITIESNQPEGAVSGSMDGMTINVNVNIGSEDTEDEADQQPALVQQNGLSWYQAAILCLLSGILVCLIKRR